MVRFKNRYVLLQIKSDKKYKLSSSGLADTLRKAIYKHYGDFGLASVSNLCVKLLNDRHKIAIVRISHGPHRFITSIIPLLNKAGKELARFQILYIGATIRQCKKHLISHENTVIRKIIAALSSDAERKEFYEELAKAMDF